MKRASHWSWKLIHVSEGGVPEEGFGKAFQCLGAAVRWAPIAHSSGHHLPPSHSEGWITGRLHSGSCGPASCPPTPLSTLHRRRGTDAGGQAHLQADGKDRSCWRGPRSVCLLHSDQLRGPARVQGSRPQGKPSSSAPASAPRTASASGELACSLGPQTPDPPAPALLLAPWPGPCQPWA